MSPPSPIYLPYIFPISPVHPPCISPTSPVHLAYISPISPPRKVRKAWAFRFDWWFRTRTPQELGRRVEVLSKLIEKEVP